MKTRGFWTSFALFTAYSVPAFGCLAAFIIAVTKVFAFLDGRLPDDFIVDLILIALGIGAMLGIPLSLWQANENKAITITEDYDHQQSFLQYLDAALQACQYRIHSRDGQTYLYKPTDGARLFSGNVILEAAQGLCTITGPKYCLSELQAKLAQARLTGDFSVSTDDETPESETTVEQPSIASTPTGTTPTIPVIPKNCPRCIAPLTLDKVQWTGPLSAACPNCGASIDVEWRKIG
jgi:hypothetical protein